MELNNFSIEVYHVVNRIHFVLARTTIYEPVIYTSQRVENYILQCLPFANDRGSLLPLRLILKPPFFETYRQLSVAIGFNASAAGSLNHVHYITNAVF